MHFTIKSILPLLAMLAMAAAQSTTSTSTPSSSSNSNSNPSLPTRFADISEQCQKVLNSTEVTPGCASNVEADVTNNGTKSLTILCDAPSDNAVGHRCSKEQVTKSLDILEASCKAELNEAQAAVQELYASWLSYSLNLVMLCTKDSTGKYCMDTITGNNTKTQPDGSPACDTCYRSVLENAASWKPPRSPSLGGDIYREQMSALTDAANKCNVSIANSADSSSAAAIHYPTMNVSVLTGLAVLATGTLMMLIA
ncbi:hypothetical protein BDF22DRAFT_291163 [Syncephalis plumigaleata]|nr:hypothetical protein BDF22DRAFT_291163 [Syncephalis plumigaleata]